MAKTIEIYEVARMVKEAVLPKLACRILTNPAALQATQRRTWLRSFDSRIRYQNVHARTVRPVAGPEPIVLLGEG